MCVFEFLVLVPFQERPLVSFGSPWCLVQKDNEWKICVCRRHHAVTSADTLNLGQGVEPGDLKKHVKSEELITV